MKKCAVFSCKGLGDGLLSLLVSNNLCLNEYEVTTYHSNKLSDLQNWFLHLPIKPFPMLSATKIVESFDLILVSFDDSSTFILDLIEEGKRKNKLFVLNPSVSRRMGSQPFYKDSKFSPHINMVENIQNFCKNTLNFDKIARSNGIKNPYNYLIHRKFSKRIVIHPTSAKAGKNWPIEKYIKLAKILEKRNFEPVFVLSSFEEKSYKFLSSNGIKTFVFSNFDNLGSFIYESGFMIGNDSGIGHLASCLKIPTFTIFRSKKQATLWRPSFYSSKVFFPNQLIPNFSPFRIRDKNWKKFISVQGVLKCFFLKV